MSLQWHQNLVLEMHSPTPPPTMLNVSNNFFVSEISTSEISSKSASQWLGFFLNLHFIKFLRSIGNQI